MDTASDAYVQDDSSWFDDGGEMLPVQGACNRFLGHELLPCRGERLIDCVGAQQLDLSKRNEPVTRLNTRRKVRHAPDESYLTR